MDSAEQVSYIDRLLRRSRISERWDLFKKKFIQFLTWESWCFDVGPGRAAMLGYAAGYLVDGATGIGLVDQQNSFFGKLLLFITVVGVLAIRKNSDVDNLRNLAQESTYYDKQWQATWKDVKDRNKTDSLWGWQIFLTVLHIVIM